MRVPSPSDLVPMIGDFNSKKKNLLNVLHVGSRVNILDVSNDLPIRMSSQGVE